MEALVVDDSRTTRRILSGILQEIGFEVNGVGDGKEAIELLDGSHTLPSLILVDWNMPVMDGLEFVRTVRSNDRYQDIKLMMVTTECEMEESSWTHLRRVPMSL